MLTLAFLCGMRFSNFWVTQLLHALLTFSIKHRVLRIKFTKFDRLKIQNFTNWITIIQVFHYCQENQKHSWICPEGFSFHQVHLICMPPSGENICQQSSKYHVVNDYLYKPVNLAEHESKPNITLRYSERYYPENFYQDDRQDNDDYQERQRQPVSEFLS